MPESEWTSPPSWKERKARSVELCRSWACLCCRADLFRFKLSQRCVPGAREPMAPSGAGLNRETAREATEKNQGEVTPRPRSGGSSWRVARPRNFEAIHGLSASSPERGDRRASHCVRHVAPQNRQSHAACGADMMLAARSATSSLCRYRSVIDSVSLSGTSPWSIDHANLSHGPPRPDPLDRNPGRRSLSAMGRIRPAASAGQPLKSLSEAASPHGFPAWLRITHYVNFFFLILSSGVACRFSWTTPGLYWNVHCTPGTDWLRLTPIEVPTDRLWTANDDNRHLSPWIGLPGYRHTVGMARHWHFFSVLFWVGNGLIFTVLLFGTGQWRRLVPASWSVVPDAWAVFVHYTTFHLPPEPNGFYHYNALQQLSYFGAVFVLAPLAIVTGPSMSPAFTSRFPWYPKLPGNRQIGRSLHFLVMCAFVAFLIPHVAMVVLPASPGT